MSRFMAGCKTGAGSTTLPLISLYAASGSGGAIREIGVFNTTSTAFDIKLVRLTTAGTQGSGLTEAKYDPNGPGAACTAFNTHSGNPTLGDDCGYRASLGAAIGAGVIWTMGDAGVRIQAGTANGVGVIIENGTGQPAQAYIIWDE